MVALFSRNLDFSIADLLDELPDFTPGGVVIGLQHAATVEQRIAVDLAFVDDRFAEHKVI
jgi:hypothetical protein